MALLRRKICLTQYLSEKKILLTVGIHTRIIMIPLYGELRRLFFSVILIYYVCFSPIKDISNTCKLAMICVHKKRKFMVMLIDMTKTAHQNL